MNPFDHASLDLSMYKGITMGKVNRSAIAACIALAFSAGAMAAQGMSKDEYKAARGKIAADYKTAKAGCDSKTANAKDVCMAEARGVEKVAKAELDARNKPGTKATAAVSMAKAEAEYAVAKEKCDDKAGNDRAICVKEARSAEARAKAAAKAPRQAAQASKPAPEKAGAAAPKKESAGEYVDDATITAKVKAAVLGEATLKSAEINVETYKGVVQLSGFVRSRADIDKAVQVARGIKGATSVKNDMIVKGQQ